MLFRVLAIIALVALAYWLFSKYAPRVARDPRLRVLFAGVGAAFLRNWLETFGRVEYRPHSV